MAFLLTDPAQTVRSLFVKGDPFRKVFPNEADSVAYDSDALAFFERAELTNSIQKNAVNDLVVGIKNFGLWGKIYAIYPFVGGSSLAHSKNLKGDSFNITWVNSPTHNANGVTSDGISAYGICDGLAGLPGEIFLAVYLKANPSDGSFRRHCGVIEAAFANAYFIDKSDSDQDRCYLGDLGTSSVAVGSGPRTGPLIATWTDVSTVSLIHYENVIGSTTGLSPAIPANVDMYVLAAHIEGSGPGSISAATLSAFAVGDRLSEAESIAFNEIVETFQSALGRAA